MFKNNRYTIIYKFIVARAKSESRSKKDSVYYENHHIIPRSLGGTDTPENLVLLTSREHYFCHRLLTRMTDGRNLSKMYSAFCFMVFGPTKFQKRFPTSRHLAIAKQLARKRQPCPSAIAKMAASLTGRKLTEEHKINISKGAVGFTLQARQARAEELQKPYDVIMPTGQIVNVLNLKSWCREHHFNYSTAHNNIKYDQAVRCGALKGYKFKLSSLPV